MYGGLGVVVAMLLYLGLEQTFCEVLKARDLNLQEKVHQHHCSKAGTYPALKCAMYNSRYAL
jgi:hypothetical protein